MRPPGGGRVVGVGGGAGASLRPRRGASLRPPGAFNSLALALTSFCASAVYVIFLL